MLTINSITGDENKIWFTTSEYPALFEYDKGKKETKLLSKIEEVHASKDNLYGVIKKKNNRIYIAPINGTYVAIFDIESNRLDKYRIECGFNGVDNKFRNVFVFKDNICFVGCKIPVLMMVNIDNNSINYIYLNDNINNYLSENNVIAYTDNEKLYWGGFKGCKVAVVNLNDKSVEFQCSEDFVGYSDIVSCSSDLFLISEIDKSIKSIDILSKKVTNLIPGSEFCPCYRNFSSVIVHNNKLWFIPFESNLLMYFNVKINEFVTIRKYTFDREINYRYSGEYDTKHIWGFCDRSQKIEIINTETDEISEMEIVESDKLIEIQCEIIKSKKNVLEGKYNIGLNTYLLSLSGEE